MATFPSRYQTELGLTATELKLVLAVMAAHRLGVRGVTIQEVKTQPGIGLCVHNAHLERKRWLRCIGLTGPNMQQKLWSPTERAWRELGFSPDESFERVPSGPGLAATFAEPALEARSA